MEIWRARERYYIGIPLMRLIIFLAFMACCVGLGTSSYKRRFF